jgi:hypothetical protein
MSAGSIVGSGRASEGRLARLLVHRGTALPGDDRIRAADNAVHALRLKSTFGAFKQKLKRLER